MVQHNIIQRYKTNVICFFPDIFSFLCNVIQNYGWLDGWYCVVFCMIIDQWCCHALQNIGRCLVLYNNNNAGCNTEYHAAARKERADRKFGWLGWCHARLLRSSIRHLLNLVVLLPLISPLWIFFTCLPHFRRWKNETKQQRKDEMRIKSNTENTEWHWLPACSV